MLVQLNSKNSKNLFDKYHVVTLSCGQTCGKLVVSRALSPSLFKPAKVVRTKYKPNFFQENETSCILYIQSLLHNFNLLRPEIKSFIINMPKFTYSWSLTSFRWKRSVLLISQSLSYWKSFQEFDPTEFSGFQDTFQREKLKMNFYILWVKLSQVTLLAKSWQNF